jgi:hypothetical protein
MSHAGIQLEFGRWQRWEDRGSRPASQSPGVYALAVSDIDLTNKRFRMLKDIVYFGMTNGSLRSRLENFHKTATLVKWQHGGADRFVYKHRRFTAVVNRLYVALWPFETSPKPLVAETLRLKGRVLQAEYECFAEYVENFERLPEFNRSDSPKYTAKVKEF